MKRSFCFFGLSVLFVGFAQASYIIENFNSYADNADMNSLGGWSVSNSISSDPIAIAAHSTWDGSTASAFLGGVPASTPGTATLSKSATVSFDGPTSLPNFVQFDVAYVEATTGARDSYSFLISSNVGALLTIDLTPASPGEYSVAWNSPYMTGSGTIGTISDSTGLWKPTQFRLETSDDGVGGVNYTFTNAGTPISSGTFSGGLTASDQFTGFSASVITDNTGNGYVAIDNVYVIPEPSSALLGLMGAAFAFTRRRR